MQHEQAPALTAAARTGLDRRPRSHLPPLRCALGFVPRGASEARHHRKRAADQPYDPSGVEREIGCRPTAAIGWQTHVAVGLGSGCAR